MGLGLSPTQPNEYIVLRRSARLLLVLAYPKLTLPKTQREEKRRGREEIDKRGLVCELSLFSSLLSSEYAQLSSVEQENKSMALVSCYIPLASSLPSPLAVSATPISRVLIKPLISFPQKHCISTTVIVTKRSRLRIGAASDAVNGTVGEAGSGGEVGPVTKEEAVVGVDKLPLESKLQERLDQKLKMKMAKKIRLRRKRLVMKRKLRKKGRWPPSKMKKLKNV